MSQHFAASWLKSLSAKLDSLVEWTFAAGKKDSGLTHRNLFREFFSAPFYKTLALVDEAKRTDFLRHIEKNLYKFEAQSQQFPLGCLCTLLEHGKESPQTQEKVGAWVDFLLGRLRSSAGMPPPQGKAAADDVIEIILSLQFQKFVPVMDERLRTRLADGLGERLGELNDETRAKILESVPAVLEKIEHIVVNCTEELNTWLASAPRYPSTPLVLADIFAKLDNPLVKYYTAIKDTTKKESFLVAVALVIQGLRTRFRWMCVVEPEVDAVGLELQRRLFFVDGNDVMEKWLVSRLSKFNTEVATRSHTLTVSDLTKKEVLRSRLQGLFPERDANDPMSGWVSLDGPTRVSETILQWLRELGGMNVPRHTLQRDTVGSVLSRFGGLFEIEPGSMRARLQLSPVHVVPPPARPPGVPGGTVPPAPALPAPVPPPPSGGAPLGPPGLVMPPLACAPAMQPPPPMPPPAGAPPDVDNLVDLLMNETLQEATEEKRRRVQKVSHGVYMIGNLGEVTLHTLSGRLFVYRVGDSVRHCPVKQVLQEEGILQESSPESQMPSGLPQPPAGFNASASAASTGPGSSVDTSSVARMVQQAAQISSGATTTKPPQQSATPFGQQKTDAQALVARKNEAAARANEISKQIVRRAINFDDNKLLRKLMSKGMKHDKQWLTAYQEHCAAKNLAPDGELKKLGKDVLISFIEKHMVNSIHEDWAKKIMHPDPAKKEKKKEKKAAKKKEKKQKGSDSSSSEDGGGADGESTALAPLSSGASAEGPPPPHDPGAFGMMGGFPAGGMPPPGMGLPPDLMAMGMGPMGAPGMPPWGMPAGMMPPGMPWGMDAGMMPPGMPGFETDSHGDQRAPKKAKMSKEEKPKKRK
eukprot:TRINITY_DN71487_c0_g1_i1.p1 TRINITY_DN71487_c0_g1~~TRINITY_DN71487_c0_g1_i1.p1  ORF type:complete len:869 (+),score=170.77 TRINITY_DN71487_c0_g1_i1:121-2727(+)